MAGLLAGGLLAVQAMLLAHVIVAGFLGHQGPAALLPALAGLAGVFALRALLVFAADWAGSLAAERVRTALRHDVVDALLRMSPSRLAGERAGELTEALTEGVEALDGYFGRYLPQVALAATVPLLVIAWTLPRDWVSAAIMAVTAPLVPAFMALIGAAAHERAERRWQSLSMLSAHFLDLVRGLPTLRAFARGRDQLANVRRVSEQYRRATTATLQVAFLSSLVLELAATVGTALVAVAIGLRLDRGGLDLETGLAILILTPEVYLPLRRLGAQFHAGVEALSPAERLFALLDQQPAVRGAARRVDLRRDPVALQALHFAYPGRAPLLDAVSLTLAPGAHVGLIGPSGAGKSTLVALLLGFEKPSAGRVMAGGTDLADADLRAYRDQIAWVPQRPTLFGGSIAANIRLGRTQATDWEVAEAARLVGLDLPLDREVGEAGRELSAGQRQRVGLARAVLRNAPLVILDEPAAHLDPEARDQIAVFVRGLRGQTVLLITHDARLGAACDRTVALETGVLHETNHETFLEAGT